MRIMIGLAATVIMGSLAVAAPTAKTTAVANEKIHFSVGLGYRICAPDTPPPSLVSAFDCPGLESTLNPVEVELVSKPSSSPSIKYWEGTYADSVTFRSRKYTVKLEMLVMMSEQNGVRTAYIDGRLTDTMGSKSSYFRIAGAGGYDKLTYSTVYSIPYSYTSNGEAEEFSGVLTVSSLVPEGTHPLIP